MYAAWFSFSSEVKTHFLGLWNKQEQYILGAWEESGQSIRDLIII